MCYCCARCLVLTINYNCGVVTRRNCILCFRHCRCPRPPRPRSRGWSALGRGCPPAPRPAAGPVPRQTAAGGGRPHSAHAPRRPARLGWPGTVVWREVPSPGRIMFSLAGQPGRRPNRSESGHDFSAAFSRPAARHPPPIDVVSVAERTHPRLGLASVQNGSGGAIPVYGYEVTNGNAKGDRQVHFGLLSQKTTNGKSGKIAIDGGRKPKLPSSLSVRLVDILTARDGQDCSQPLCKEGWPIDRKNCRLLFVGGDSA